MTIASSMYSVYKSDDTISLYDLLEKCGELAAKIESCSTGNITVYEFEDGSRIKHCDRTDKVEVL